MDIRSEIIGTLRNRWGWFLAVGIGMVILGVITVVMPFSMSLTIEILLGSIFAVGGVFKFIHAIKSIGAGGWFWELLTALLYVAAGIVLIFFPLEGLITLTALLAALFVIVGIFRILAAIQLRALSSWIWMLLSGILALILGIMLWAEFPGDAAWALGLIVGIDLIFGGWAVVMFSCKVKTLA